jgi:glutathione peroxidase-family protein
MSNSTINGRYRIHYPFDKNDVQGKGTESLTDAEKTSLANEWNASHEAKWNYKKHRVDGETTSSLNPTTGKRENIVRTYGYEVIGEQLDKLWHDIDEGKLDKNGDFYTSIKTIKDRWSKT